MPLQAFINLLCFADGFLIVADGDGHREITLKMFNKVVLGEQGTFTGGVCRQELFDLFEEPVQWEQLQTQKPVLLLTDSMGRCIPITDSVIEPVVKVTYTFDQMAADIAADVVSLQHKFVIIWSGAKEVANLDGMECIKNLKALINIIRVKNKNIQIYVSAIIPQPRDHHSLQHKIAQFNSHLKATVQDYKTMSPKVGFIHSHLIYLDDNLDIIRPIVENFEDGFHLNLHGAHRLRHQWLAHLGVNK